MQVSSFLEEISFSHVEKRCFQVKTKHKLNIRGDQLYLRGSDQLQSRGDQLQSRVNQL